MFPKIVGFHPKSSILTRVFHYRPSILGYHYFRKHPYVFFLRMNLPMQSRLHLIGVGVVVVVTLLWKHDAGELQLIVHQGDLVNSVPVMVPSRWVSGEVFDDMAGVLIIYATFSCPNATCSCPNDKLP